MGGGKSSANYYSHAYAGIPLSSFILVNPLLYQCVVALSYQCVVSLLCDMLVRHACATCLCHMLEPHSTLHLTHYTLHIHGTDAYAYMHMHTCIHAYIHAHAHSYIHARAHIDTDTEYTGRDTYMHTALV